MSLNLIAVRLADPGLTRYPPGVVPLQPSSLHSKQANPESGPKLETCFLNSLPKFTHWFSLNLATYKQLPVNPHAEQKYTPPLRAATAGLPGVGLTTLLGSSWAAVVVLPSHPSSVFQSARGSSQEGAPRTPATKDRATIEADARMLSEKLGELV